MTGSEWVTEPDGAPGVAMARCLRAAIAAPSIHNSQPWLFRPHGEAVDVLADRRRGLPAADPDGRELLISVGAAVANLRVALAAAGRTPITRLLPDPPEPDLAATVQAGPSAEPDPLMRRLAEAIPRRQTNRRPYGSTRVRPAVLAELAGAAHAEGAALIIAGPELRAELLDVLRRAENTLRVRADYRDELTEWTAADPRRSDGVPPSAFGVRPELAALPVRDFDPGRAYPRPVEAFEHDPTLAVVFTADDEPRDWLVAGQALERVLLTATAHGVASAILSQAVEVPELRRLVMAPEPGLVPQSMIRLGYAGRTRAVPRRPLSDVLVRAARLQS
ncbi:MAG: hypothetical protein QOJ50_1201 [Cryptosporangiaceae bacterium]|nr:hypothetical protein [Cryptosporangiaceae bacterium]